MVAGSNPAVPTNYLFTNQSLGPLPEEQCRMPRGMRQAYKLVTEAMGGADPVMLQQRDWMFANNLQLPLVF